MISALLVLGIGVFRISLPSSSTMSGHSMGKSQVLSVHMAIGAIVNELEIKRTIIVSPKTGKFRTLHQGLHEAQKWLVQGIGVRVQVNPGLYRESVVDFDWTAGKCANTLLVIEGIGKVEWSGADVYPVSQFSKQNGLWSTKWLRNWGNFAYSWSAKGLIGHRSEMMFVKGEPLYPRILEQYDVEGMVQDPARPGQIAYRYKDFRNPAQTLLPGQFGVAERPENGSRLFFRPNKVNEINDQSVEISVRRNLLDLSGKSNVVLRNITFTKTANYDADYGANNAIRFSIDPKLRSNNVLIDKCKVTWSAQTGLHIDGDHWTIRNSEFSFNGGSGIASGKSLDILFEGNKTNFNVWRLWLAGELGYYTGGFKMHETTRHTIRGHQAIGNLTMGAWWDVHCREVYVKDLVAVGNAANLQFELSEGPFVAERILLAGGRSDMGQFRLWEHGNTALRNSILYSNYAGGGKNELYELRWFGRDDQHARMAKITAGMNFAENNIFVGGNQLENFGMIDDIRGREWSQREPLSYRGKNNIFWHPTNPEFQNNWIINKDRTGNLAERAVQLADWKSKPNYEEVNSTRVDPGFENPTGHDYRFTSRSALFKDRANYPQFRLSQSDGKAWRKFANWIGFNPDAWNEPRKD